MILCEVWFRRKLLFKQWKVFFSIFSIVFHSVLYSTKFISAMLVSADLLFANKSAKATPIANSFCLWINDPKIPPKISWHCHFVSTNSAFNQNRFKTFLMKHAAYKNEWKKSNKNLKLLVKYKKYIYINKQSNTLIFLYYKSI